MAPPRRPHSGKPHPDLALVGPDAPGPRGRPSWSGLLRLSLVAVPVKAYPACSSSAAIAFHQLHAHCGQRIQHQKPFEVKWDGVRALAAVDHCHWRLWGRRRASYDGRYPELEVLRRLPAGTVVDGELVLFQDGRPDLHALLRRHHLVQPDRIRHASRQSPIHYLLFDLLYHRGRPLLQEPWQRRRRVLAEMLSVLDVPELVFSAALAGSGQEVFAQVVAQGHEGIMAKHQSSPYLPGQRSAAQAEQAVAMGTGQASKPSPYLPATASPGL